MKRIRQQSHLDAWASAVVFLGLGAATIDYWSLTPAETEALMKMWDRKQKHEAQRFNVLISCITGTPVPTDDTDPEATKQEFRRILSHLNKHG